MSLPLPRYLVPIVIWRVQIKNRVRILFINFVDVHRPCSIWGLLLFTSFTTARGGGGGVPTVTPGCFDITPTLLQQYKLVPVCYSSIISDLWHIYLHLHGKVI
jgi:hypothetical protein